MAEEETENVGRVNSCFVAQANACGGSADVSRWPPDMIKKAHHRSGQNIGAWNISHMQTRLLGLIEG